MEIGNNTGAFSLKKRYELNKITDMAINTIRHFLLFTKAATSLFLTIVVYMKMDHNIYPVSYYYCQKRKKDELFVHPGLDGQLGGF